MANQLTQNSEVLFDNIRLLLNQSRKQVVQAVNSAMVQTYWQIGQLIVEDEGQARAEYGKAVLKALSISLTKEFGKGFDVRNLRNMRGFYLTFPIRNALHTELSWTHYRTLLRIENEQARQWYLNEAIEQAWSARALERQIGSLYYERLLATQAQKQDLRPVLAEAEQKTGELALSTKDYLRDPYIFDFLGLPSGHLQESELKQALIDNLQKFLLELGKGFAFVERQQRIATDECFDSAILIDEIVTAAVAEFSINPQEIENQIRRKLLPVLFKSIGMDKAKVVVTDIIQITRLGVAGHQ